MKLKTVKLSFGIFHGGIGAVGGFAEIDKSFRQHAQIIGMTHENGLCSLKTFENRRFCRHFHIGGAVFADGTAFHGASAEVGHELKTVANSEHWYSESEKLIGAFGRGVVINAGGTARQNDSDGIHAFDFFNGGIARLYKGVYSAFSDSAGNKLLILTAEVQN